MFEAITFLVICYSSPCSDRSRPESYNTIIKHKLGVFKKSSFSSWFLAKVSKWTHKSLLLIHISDNQRVIKAAQWVTDTDCDSGQGSLWDVGCWDTGCPSVRHLLCASCDIWSGFPASQGSGWNLLWCVLMVSPCRASQRPPQKGQCSSVQMPFEKVILRRIKIPELGDLWSDKMKLKPLPPKPRIDF